jgi:hypothetical protein
MKRQAAYHGEIGANGKPYQKGQFIAEQKEYQRTNKLKSKGLKKVEVAPYVWEVPPNETSKSIYK